jgi:hypothetical protein
MHALWERGDISFRYTDDFAEGSEGDVECREVDLLAGRGSSDTVDTWCMRKCFAE